MCMNLEIILACCVPIIISIILVFLAIKNERDKNIK